MFISIFERFFIFCVILSVTLLSFCSNLEYSHRAKNSQSLTQTNNSSDLKYILVWHTKTSPIGTNFHEGKQMFTNKKCPIAECYATSNRQLLKDVADFDVIVFHGRELKASASLLPQSRSPRQKYVYAMLEAAERFPVCNQMFNNYFNWTWTYKLNSDEYYGYMRIRDKEGKLIGPKEEMHWMKLEEMMPINDTLKAKLSTKKIAAAWFVSNCRTPSDRGSIAEQLQTELAKYDLQLDIYGRCGTKVCPRSKAKECFLKLETDYYFYLSFENSFNDDYVTEKLLNGLNHYTVPVVFGGANYTRFMPDGIYLTAEKSRISELAAEMANIINDQQKYYNFFKWHNHYSYHHMWETPETNPFCKICALANNNEKFLRTSVYENFVEWWNTPHKCD